MSAKISDPAGIRAYETLRASGPRGRALAEVLDRYGTRVRVTPRIYGGFTLNFINSIFIMPLREDASEWEYKAWVTLLAHEACHVEQRYWVDSVQQEIRAYTAQATVGHELGIELGYVTDAFVRLDPDSPEHQRLAQAALLSLFAGSPAGIVYASLPLLQPTRLRAFLPAVRESVAVLRAALTPKK
jgi:hypothetical protein